MAHLDLTSLNMAINCSLVNREWISRAWIDLWHWWSDSSIMGDLSWLGCLFLFLGLTLTICFTVFENGYNDSSSVWRTKINRKQQNILDIQISCHSWSDLMCLNFGCYYSDNDWWVRNFRKLQADLLVDYIVYHDYRHYLFIYQNHIIFITN